MELINKDGLVTELKAELKKYRDTGDDYWIPAINTLKDIISLIDTLEVKEVNLDKSLTDFMSRYAYENNDEYPSTIDIAEHFFKLGIALSNKAQKK